MTRLASVAILRRVMPTKPELSIVIVTYNAQDVILDCLASLETASASLSGDHVDAEVIVVDNASTDQTIALLRERPGSVQFIETGYNAGYSGGNNAGIRASTAPLILLLNPDTVVHPGALRALVDFAGDHPEAGLIGCRLIYPNGRLQHSCFRFPGLRTAFFGFFPLVPLDSTCNGRYPVRSYEQPHPVERLLGAALLVRRQMIERIGLLDERTFPMYFEEQTGVTVPGRQAGRAIIHQGPRSRTMRPSRPRVTPSACRRHSIAARHASSAGITGYGLMPC